MSAPKYSFFVRGGPKFDKVVDPESCHCFTVGWDKPVLLNGGALDGRIG
jgi:hypothetical protein